MDLALSEIGSFYLTIKKVCPSVLRVFGVNLYEYPILPDSVKCKYLPRLAVDKLD